MVPKIACAADHDKFTVWTPWSVQGCIPEYDALSWPTVTDDLSILNAHLDQFGPAILNYPNVMGLSVFLRAIKEGNQSRVDKMIEWALEHGVKASMVPFPLDCNAKSEPRSPKCSPSNGLQMAIESRSLGVIRSVVNGLLLGLTTKHTLAQIFQESLLNLSSMYPAIFLEIVQHDQMLQIIGEVEVSEKLFSGANSFVTGTSTMYCPPQSKLLSMWVELNKGIISSYTKVHAQAKVLPYPRAAFIGMNGILHPLLVNEAPSRIYSSKPLQCIIEYKWNAYAERAVYHEISHYIAMLFFFTLYTIILGHDKMGNETAEDLVKDKRSIVGLVSLGLAALLAVAHLLLEIKQIIVYVREGRVFGFNGLLFWVKSPWNVLEIISLLFVAFFLPALHLGDWKSEIDKIETGAAAVTSIMLWWKLLYYAQAFRKTGPLVIMIFEIIKDMLFFLITAAAVFFAFGLAFFVIFRHDIEEDEMNKNKDVSISESFGGFGQSLLTTFGMMLGTFDPNLFYSSSVGSIAVLLFVLYMITLMVILLNLLIAIMVSKFLFFPLSITDCCCFSCENKTFVVDSNSSDIFANEHKSEWQWVPVLDSTGDICPTSTPRSQYHPNWTSRLVERLEGLVRGCYPVKYLSPKDSIGNGMTTIHQVKLNLPRLASRGCPPI